PSLVRSTLVPATLISVMPLQAAMREDTETFLDAEDRVIGPRALAQALHSLGDSAEEFRRALIVRTLPNSSTKRSAKYSGTNPPYFTQAAMRLIRSWGTEHLLCDLPSVERESDGGRLAVHRIFWGAGEDRGGYAPTTHKSITEMIYVDGSVGDGLYLLNLQ